MLTGFIILLAFEFVGEVLRAALHLPVPGSVFGMCLLAAVLAVAKKIATPRFTSASDRALDGLRRLSHWLLSSIGVFLVTAIAGQRMLNRLGVVGWHAIGLAAGVAGSGIAAAEVAAQNETGAAFAAIGVAMNGILTALLVPLFVALWHLGAGPRWIGLHQPACPSRQQLFAARVIFRRTQTA
jgi:putative effector of murein hydrolase